MLPSADKLYGDADFIFQQDLAPAHTAKGTKSSRFNDHAVTVLDWPANSPDLNPIEQWFSNFLHQVPPQKLFGFPSTTFMTNIKMQYKWLPTAPGVCSRCVCVCVCSLLCVCALWMG